jgi:hypothetical protein
MDMFKLLATLFPMALAAGINLYATILIAGASIRLGWIENPPEALAIFASWPVLITAGVFYLLEFFADKVHFIDDIWDFIHTFIRPVGIGVLVLASVSKMDPMIAVFAAIAAGGVSFVSHTAKAGGRMSINALSPFENVKNIIISLVEDAFSAGLVFMAMKYPYFTAAVALVIFIMLIILLPMLFGWMKYTFVAVLLSLKAMAKKRTESDVIPGQHMALIDHVRPEAAGKCKSQGVPGSGGRKGYLAVLPLGLAFTFSKWFGLRHGAWKLDKGNINAAYIRRRLLVDVLEVHYKNGKGKAKICRFVFFKDRAPLLEKIGKLAGVKQDKKEHPQAAAEIISA